MIYFYENKRFYNLCSNSKKINVRNVTLYCVKIISTFILFDTTGPTLKYCNPSFRRMSAKQMCVPTIAITQELDDNNKNDTFLSLEEALTDVEVLDVEKETFTKKKCGRKSKLRIRLIDNTTDCEDLEASDAEEFQTHSKVENYATDFNFHDMGANTETHKVGMKNSERRKAACGISRMNVQMNNQSALDVTNLEDGLTDVEDFNMSGNEEESDLPDIILNSNIYEYPGKQNVSEALKKENNVNECMASTLTLPHKTDALTDIEMLSGDKSGDATLKKQKVRRRRRRGHMANSVNEVMSDSEKIKALSASQLLVKKSKNTQETYTQHYKKRNPEVQESPMRKLGNTSECGALTVPERNYLPTDEEYFSDVEVVSPVSERECEITQLQEFDGNVLQYAESVNEVRREPVLPVINRHNKLTNNALSVPSQTENVQTDLESLDSDLSNDEVKHDYAKTNMETFGVNDNYKNQSNFYKFRNRKKNIPSVTSKNAAAGNLAAKLVETESNHTGGIGYSRAETATPHPVRKTTESSDVSRTYNNEPIKKRYFSNLRNTVCSKGRSTDNLHTDVEEINISDNEYFNSISKNNIFSLELSNDHYRVTVKQFMYGTPPSKKYSMSFGLSEYNGKLFFTVPQYLLEAKDTFS